jgi:hypothetical protein
MSIHDVKRVWDSSRMGTLAAAVLSVLAVTTCVQGQALPVPGAFEPLPYSEEIATSFAPTNDGPRLRMRGVTGRDVSHEDSYATFGMHLPLLAGERYWFADAQMVMSARSRSVAPESSNGLGANIGLGMRRPWADGILGISLWYDFDTRYEVDYNQLGVSWEWIGNRWDFRANGYIPVGETSRLIGVTELTDPYFCRDHVFFERTLFYEEAMAGADIELGRHFPGFLNMVDTTVFGSLYAFGGPEGSSATGGAAHLRVEPVPNLALQVSVNSNSINDTNVVFSVTGYFPPFRGGGFFGPRSRMSDRVRRLENIVVGTTDVYSPVLATHPDGVPLSIVHVNSAAAMGGNGTIDDPFMTLAEAQAGSSPRDIIYGHADSVFASQSIVLQQDQFFLGEGIDHFIETAQVGPMLLPRATDGTALPLLTGSPGNAVTLADGVQVSGFTIDSPGEAALYADSSVTGRVDLNRNEITGGRYGVHLDGSTGTFAISETAISGTTVDALRVEGGAPDVTATVAVDNTAGHLLHVLDTTGGTVDVGGTLNDDGGAGVLIENAQGAVVMGDAALANTTGAAVTVDGGAGAVTLGALDITTPGGAGLLVQNRSGGTVGVTSLAVTDPGGSGVLIQNNTGATAINLGSTTISGATNAAGIAIQGNSDETSVLFGSLNVASQGVAALLHRDGSSLQVVGATELQAIDASGLDLQNSTGSFLLNELNVAFTGARTGLDFRNSTVQFDANNTTISGDGSAGSIAIDLSGTGNPNGPNAQTPNIILAGDSGETAVISNVETGVLMGNLVDGTAGAYFRYGNQEQPDSGSQISVTPFGTTLNTRHLITVNGFDSGRYEFQGVLFDGTASFEVDHDFLFVGSAAEGRGDGSTVDNRLDAAGLLALPTSDLDGKTIVLINDGGQIDLAANTLNLGVDTVLDGFGNGNSFEVYSIPENVILTTPAGAPTDPVVIDDPFGNGAATLTAAATNDVVNLSDNNRIANINITGGANLVAGTSFNMLVVEGVGMSGAVDGASVFNLNNAGGDIVIMNNTIDQQGALLLALSGGNADVHISQGTGASLNGSGILVQNTTGGSVSIADAVLTTDGNTAVTLNGNAAPVTLTDIAINRSPGDTAVSIDATTPSTGDVLIDGASTIDNTPGTAFAIGAGMRNIDASAVAITSDGTTDSPVVGVTGQSGGTIALGSVTNNGSTSDAVIVSQNQTGGALNFGAVAISGFGDNSADTAVRLQGTGGQVNFADLDVVTVNGAGLDAGSITLDPGASPTIQATGGAALILSGTSLAGGSAVFDSVSSTGSAGNGIDLTNVSGDLTIAAGALSDSAGTSLRIDGGTDDILYAGTIAQNLDATAVSIRNRAAGTVALGGAITANTLAATAIDLVDNAGGRIDFTSGSLAVSTGTGTGFNATGGGTLNVTGGGNTIQTANGLALNLDSVVVGDAGMQFASVDKTLVDSLGEAIRIHDLSQSTQDFGLQIDAATIAGTAAAFDGIAIDASSAAIGFGSATIDNTGGSGIRMANNSGPLSFDTVDIDGTGDAGIVVVDNPGRVTVGGGTIGQSATTAGVALEVQGSDGDVTVAADITNAADRSVQITGRTGGAVTVSGEITDTGSGIYVGNNTGGETTFSGAAQLTFALAQDGVTLENNTGHTVNFTSGSLAISTRTGTGFQAFGGGTLNVTGDGNSITTTNGIALNLNGMVVGDNGIQFATIDKTLVDGMGEAIRIDNLSQTADSFGVQIDAATIAGTTAPYDGIAIDTSSATIGFGSATLDSTGGAGISLTDNSGLITFDSIDIDGTGEAGLVINNNTGTIEVAGGTIGQSATTGGIALEVDGGDGDITVAANITNQLDRSVQVTGRSGGAVTISGDIDETGRGIYVGNNTAGQTTFSGAAQMTFTRTEDGVTLENNSGHAINFTGGGLDIQASTGTGFSATSGGTVTVTGAGNKINTTEGPALVLQDVTIGHDGFQFAEVNKNDAAGAVSAITIDNVNQVAGSAGMAIDSVKVAGTGGSNIEGVSVRDSSADLVLGTVDINGTSGNGISLFDNGGSVAINGGTIGGTVADGIHSVNTDLSVADVTIGQATPVGGDGIRVSNNQDHVLAIDRVTVQAATGAGIRVAGSGGGTTYVTSVDGNTVERAEGGGMLFDTVTFDADGSAAGSVVEVAGGATTIGDTADTNNVLGTGLSLVNTRGKLAFDSLNIGNEGGTGLDLQESRLQLNIGDLNIASTGAATGIDFRRSRMLFESDNTTITGDGTPGSLGIDLSGSQNWYGPNAMTPNILLANDAGETAAIADVETGVVMGNTTDGTAGAYFRFGNQDEPDSGSSIAVIPFGVTLDTSNLVSTDPYTSGRYEFVGVNFTGAASFENFLYVGSTAAGQADGATVDDRLDAAGLLALTPAQLANKTLVLVNDGAAIDLGENTLLLGNNTNIDSFGFGNVIQADAPVNVIVSTIGLPVADPFGNGAAKLTADAGYDVLNLNTGNHFISNVAISGGASLITGTGFSSLLVSNTTLDGVGAGESVFDLNSTGNVLVENTLITAVGSYLLSINGGSGNVTIDGTGPSVIGSGVKLTNFNGNLNLLGTELVGSTFTTFGVNGGSGNIFTNGTISQANNATIVNITNKSAGQVTFAGPVAGATGTANAIQLTNNNAAVIDFGSVSVSTTTGRGFNASGSGTVSLASGLVTSTGNRAVSIDDVTVGAGGVNLADVTAIGGDYGIFLDNTGSSGAVNINSATITGTSQDGIRANNVGTLAVTNSIVSGAGGHGIQVDGTGSITVVGSQFIGSGLNGIDIATLSSGLVQGNAVLGSAQRGVVIGTLDGGTVLGNIANNNASDGFWIVNFNAGNLFQNQAIGNGQDGIDIESFTGGTAFANIVQLNTSDGFEITTLDGGNLNANIAGDPRDPLDILFNPPERGNGDDGFDIGNFISGTMTNNFAGYNDDNGYEVNPATPPAGATVSGNVGTNNGGNNNYP